jgi:hypothetical protein
VRAIATAHGAAVRIGARPQGGLIAEARFPRAVTAPQLLVSRPEGQPWPSEHPPRKTILRLLLVGDRTKLAMTVAAGLRRREIAVDLAFDGDDPLKRLAFTDYEVMVLDRLVPGLAMSLPSQATAARHTPSRIRTKPKSLGPAASPEDDRGQRRSRPSDPRMRNYTGRLVSALLPSSWLGLVGARRSP